MKYAMSSQHFVAQFEPVSGCESIKISLKLSLVERSTARARNVNTAIYLRKSVNGKGWNNGRKWRHRRLSGLQSKARLLGRFLREMRQHALQILRSFFFVGFQATGEKNFT